MAYYNWRDANPVISSERCLGELVKNLSLKSRILDVGCGNGYIGRKLLENNYDYVGLDADPSGIAIAKEFNETCFEIYKIGDIDFPFAGKFDAIILCEVLFHIYDIDSLYNLLRNKLNDNGKVIIITPNIGYFKLLTLAFLGKLDKYFSPLWQCGYIRMFSKRMIIHFMKDNFILLKSYRFGGTFSLSNSLYVFNKFK
jgi:2-polyprenyl-3-methyl-5-hydroxy-6-metoxy-1,4-benzoquinol methylase